MSGLLLPADVRWSSAVVSISHELMQDALQRTPFLDAFRDAEFARVERERNGHIGPMHGPGKNELWDIERKAYARERLHEWLDELMPGKKPGAFIPTPKENA